MNKTNQNMKFNNMLLIIFLRRSRGLKDTLSDLLNKYVTGHVAEIAQLGEY